MKETTEQILKRIKHSKKDFKELEPIAQEAVESLRSKAALTEKESVEFDKDLDEMVENLNNNVILGK